MNNGIPTFARPLYIVQEQLTARKDASGRKMPDELGREGKTEAERL